LLSAFYLSGKYGALADLPPQGSTPINAWVQTAPNDSVTFILAEELDLDCKKVKDEFAPTAAQYFIPSLACRTPGGSCSVHGPREPLAKAGAAAREMLVDTAGETWNVDPSTCHTGNSSSVILA